MTVPSSPVPIPPTPPVQTPPPIPQPEKPGVRTQTTVLTVLLLVVIALAVGVIFYFDQLASLPFVQRMLQIVPEGNKPNIVLPATPPSPTPKPTPTRLKEGKDTYSISQWEGAPGPRIPSLTLDPLDPKVGQKQILTVQSTYMEPVDSVTIEFRSDNSTRTLPLSLRQGGATNGSWETEWIVDDTVLYTYILTITAKNGTVSNSVIVAPRQ